MAELGEVSSDLTIQSEAQRAVGQLRESHDDRFDCDDFDLTKREDGNEDVLVCRSCRFVVARLNRGFEGGDA